MLYLHCGWIRTGTSSLQSAFIARRDELTSAGFTYPARWRPAEVSDHHGLIDLLMLPEAETRLALKRFQDQLRSISTKDVVISSESLTHWVADGKRDALLNLLAAIATVMPATYTWTLRNIADIGKSHYHRFVLARPGATASSKEVLGRLLADPTWPESLFAGMRELARTVGTPHYLRYASDGAHSRELLGIMRFPPALRAAIERDLDEKPRLNARATQKQAAALLNCEALSTRTGLPITKLALSGLFFGRGFRFADDRPCNLVDPEIAEELHEQALAAAHRSGFEPYLELLGDSEPDLSPRVAVDLDLLTDDDLDRLAGEMTAFSSTELLNS